MWMSLWDAITRAGSFDALLPYLQTGRIMARAAGFYTLEGALKERTDARILSRWWTQTQLLGTDLPSGRVYFEMVLADQIEDEMLQRKLHPELDGLVNYASLTSSALIAIGVELERAAVEALFPQPLVPAQASQDPEAPAPAPRHPGGRPLEWSWGAAAQHVDRSVAQHGPLPRDDEGTPVLADAFRLIREFFAETDPPGPNDSQIYKWLHNRLDSNNPPTWWDRQNSQNSQN
jgi:hypothetical protein